MTATPEWVATRDDTAAVLAAWARERGLAYQRAGLLPPASLGLRRSLGYGSRHADSRTVTSSGKGVRREGMWVKSPFRPERFSENLCSGRLPGGLQGTVAHHSWIYGGDVPDSGHRATGLTVVIAFVPDAVRVTRRLEGRPKKPGAVVDLSMGDPAYGPTSEQVDLTPSLGDRYRWDLWIEDDESVIAPAFDPAAVAALDRAAERIRFVTVDGGWLVVETDQFFVDEPALLDQLAQLASTLAQGIARAASSLPRLEPGVGLRDPADTQIRRWALDGASRVSWPQPPQDLDTAARAYEETARKGEPGRRAWQARVRVVAAFLVIAALIGGLTFASSGQVAGIAAFALIALIGLGAAVVIGSREHEESTEERTEAWGLEAFTAGYAQRRGLWFEDRVELRRRLPWPFPGYPERCMRGSLAGGVEGRIVLWRDPSEASERRFSNIALVPVPQPDAGAAPSAPFEAHRVDGWLVVRERVERSGRSAARLDALVAEAARLSGAPAPV